MIKEKDFKFKEYEVTEEFEKELNDYIKHTNYNIRITRDLGYMTIDFLLADKLIAKFNPVKNTVYKYIYFKSESELKKHCKTLLEAYKDYIGKFDIRKKSTEVYDFGECTKFYINDVYYQLSNTGIIRIYNDFIEQIFFKKEL